MNVDGPAVPTFNVPGDEAIAPGFQAISFPGYILTLRNYIFGANPDRLMLNYRCRQLLAVLHASPLVEYVLELDPRITYGFTDTPFVDDAIFQPAITQITGTTNDVLSVLGTPAAPDVSGRTRNLFMLYSVTGSSVIVSRESPPVSQKTLLNFAPLVVLPLQGAGYNFRLSTANPGQSWRVEVYNRPQTDLGQITANLDSAGAATLNALFGSAAVEPYQTFRNLWYEAIETPLRLAGLVMALVYRSEETRLSP